MQAQASASCLQSLQIPPAYLDQVDTRRGGERSGDGVQLMVQSTQSQNLHPFSSWDPETVGGLCSGGTLHAGDVDIISDDRSIYVQNIVKDFSLIVTCKNVAGVVRSVKYAIKVDQKPKPDPNVTFQVQLVNPTPYLQNEFDVRISFVAAI